MLRIIICLTLTFSSYFSFASSKLVVYENDGTNQKSYWLNVENSDTIISYYLFPLIMKNDSVLKFDSLGFQIVSSAFFENGIITNRDRVTIKQFANNESISPNDVIYIDSPLNVHDKKLCFFVLEMKTFIPVSNNGIVLLDYDNKPLWFIHQSKQNDSTNYYAESTFIKKVSKDITRYKYDPEFRNVFNEYSSGKCFFEYNHKLNLITRFYRSSKDSYKIVFSRRLE